MARYRIRARDLAGALCKIGMASPSRADPDLWLEIELELVEGIAPPAADYARVRSEHLRPLLVELVAAGKSNRQIALELNDRAMFGASGGLWHSSSVKRLRSRLGV